MVTVKMYECYVLSYTSLDHLLDAEGYVYNPKPVQGKCDAWL
jgi:hypothetical protein